MPSFGIPQSRYGSQGTISNFHTVFGVGAGETSTPPLLDLSEFPSLTNRAGQGDPMPQPSPMPGKQPYGKWNICMPAWNSSLCNFTFPVKYGMPHLCMKTLQFTSIIGIIFLSWLDLQSLKKMKTFIVENYNLIYLSKTFLNSIFCQIFYMGVTHGLLLWRKNVLYKLLQIL